MGKAVRRLQQPNTKPLFCEGTKCHQVRRGLGGSSAGGVSGRSGARGRAQSGVKSMKAVPVGKAHNHQVKKNRQSEM